jgi:hypothetical protein
MSNLKKLAAGGVPVYVTQTMPYVNNQVRVDWIKVFTHLIGSPTGGDRYGANYFLGSPSLMLALALYEHDTGEQKIQSIQSFGIDTLDSQHSQQRHAWAYWCGQAHARGIELGGTMLDYMSEPEKDIGLVNLREFIGDQITANAKKKQDEIVANLQTLALKKAATILKVHEAHKQTSTGEKP